MKLPRRTFLHLAAGAAALPAISRFAWAQAYPIRPIMIVDTFPPGGSTGIIARIIADKFSETLGQQVIVDQRAGAGGTVAAKQSPEARPTDTRSCWVTPERSALPRVSIPMLAMIRATILRQSAGLAWHPARWWSTLLFQSAQLLS